MSNPDTQSCPSNSENPPSQAPSRNSPEVCRFIPDGHSGDFNLLSALVNDSGPELSVDGKEHGGLWTEGDSLVKVDDVAIRDSVSGTPTVHKQFVGLTWNSKRLSGTMYTRRGDSIVPIGRTTKSIQISQRRTLYTGEDIPNGEYWVRSKGLGEGLDNLELDHSEYWRNLLSHPSEWKAYLNPDVQGGIVFHPPEEDRWISPGWWLQNSQCG